MIVLEKIAFVVCIACCVVALVGIVLCVVERVKDRLKKDDD